MVGVASARAAVPAGVGIPPVGPDRASVDEDRAAPRHDATVPEPFEVVGRVVAGRGAILVDGRPVGADGWDPYSGWDGRSG